MKGREHDRRTFPAGIEELGSSEDGRGRKERRDGFSDRGRFIYTAGGGRRVLPVPSGALASRLSPQISTGPVTSGRSSLFSLQTTRDR